MGALGFNSVQAPKCVLHTHLTERDSDTGCESTLKTVQQCLNVSSEAFLGWGYTLTIAYQDGNLSDMPQSKVIY